MSALSEEKIMELVGEVFADTVPQICEAIKQFDNDDKYAAIGAVTQTILASLVDFCLYGDYMLDDTAESVKWQKNIAERLVEILSDMEADNE